MINWLEYKLDADPSHPNRVLWIESGPAPDGGEHKLMLFHPDFPADVRDNIRIDYSSRLTSWAPLPGYSSDGPIFTNILGEDWSWRLIELEPPTQDESAEFFRLIFTDEIEE